METLNDKFCKVTGLTWDLNQYIASLKSKGMTDEQISEKILWLVPDGTMLDDQEGRKAVFTKELLSDETLAELGIDENAKFGPDEEPSPEPPTPNLPDILSFTGTPDGNNTGITMELIRPLPEGCVIENVVFNYDYEDDVNVNSWTKISSTKYFATVENKSLQSTEDVITTFRVNNASYQVPGAFFINYD